MPEPYAHVKFFTPDGSWTWYASEFDGDDLFYGLVDGFELEYGYFRLSELQEAQGPWGLPSSETSGSSRGRWESSMTSCPSDGANSG